MPIVFLDVPGSTYWRDWYAFVQEHMLGNGLISPTDLHLFKVTTDVDEAVHEITTFYRTYHSMRYVDGQLIIRLRQPLSAGALARLNQEFGDIVTQGEIMAHAPIDNDGHAACDLPCLRLWFNRVNFGRLRQMIDMLNQD
jgi:hypothetical protein